MLGCLRENTSGDRDPRRWGKTELDYIYLILCYYTTKTMGSGASHFSVPLIVGSGAGGGGGGLQGDDGWGERGGGGGMTKTV